MANSSLSCKVPLFLLFLIVLPITESSLNGFTSIISFGDSLADTGNVIYSYANHHVGKLPYGETFFHHPTGRFSDGRLIIDFLAEAMGIPYLPPYLPMSRNKDISGGLNFAVGGATALEPEFFEERGIALARYNNSLRTQIGWFERILPSICRPPSDCKDIFNNTLFMVGEIGGNDLNYPIFQGWQIHQVEHFIPKVIQEIEASIETLIKHGAKALVVPGNLPIGCNAVYLTKFQSSNKEDYDRSNCLIKLNAFAEHYNHQLNMMLDNLRQRQPEAAIIYADYYNSAKRLYSFRRLLGFGGGGLRACCGGGGPYNYNASAICGDNKSVKACKDPSSYISWDGIHLTEAAYRGIAKTLLNSMKALLPIVSPYKNPETNWE